MNQDQQKVTLEEIETGKPDTVVGEMEGARQTDGQSYKKDKAANLMHSRSLSLV